MAIEQERVEERKTHHLLDEGRENFVDVLATNEPLGDEIDKIQTKEHVENFFSVGLEALVPSQCLAIKSVEDDPGTRSVNGWRGCRQYVWRHEQT
ncbi:hypothetical protein F0726_02226 [Acidithiobacillus caldus]|nr:hypothetical protein F0726_02226 [Acidithiobacillus caldus]